MRIRFAFIFALLLSQFLSSCTHLIIDSETRLWVENKTGQTVSDFSIVSAAGQVKVLVPEAVESNGKSKVHSAELAGEFEFAIFAGGKMERLGKHRLGGGSAVAQIREENGNFSLSFK